MVGVVAADDGADDELEHRDPGGDHLAHRRVPALHAQVTGVHPVGSDGDVAASGELLVALEGTHRRLLAGLVTVEGVDDLAAEELVVEHEPAQHLQVLLAEGGTAGGHGRGHPGSVQRHDVGVALHHHGLVVGTDRLLRPVQPEEHLRLLVQQRLGRVHVLAELVVLEELAGTEPDDVPGGVPDRPQQPTVEAVDGTTVTHPGQACVLQLLEAEAAAQQDLRQRVPAVGCVAAAELLDELIAEATVAQHRAGLLRARVPAVHIEEPGTVELLGRPVRRDKPLPGTRFDPVHRAATLVVDVVADPLGALLDSLGEGDVLHLHEEAEDVPALAGREAVEVALVRTHMEGRRLLVLERAEALHRVHATRGELDVLADDLLDRGLLPDRGDVGVRNASSCHADHRRPPVLPYLPGSSRIATAAPQNPYAFVNIHDLTTSAQPARPFP